MVTATIDPIRVPTINLSQGEIADIEELIAQGLLAKDFLDRHFDAVDANVFGVDAKKDKYGNRIEQGLGSPGNMTRNSVEAYRRFGKDEPNYAEHLKRMEAELAKSDERRAAEAGKTRRRYGRKTAA